MIKRVKSQPPAMDYNQAIENIRNAVGAMVVEDRPSLVAILQKNGSFVSDMSSDDEVLDATFKAIKDSKSFRSDLGDYFVQEAEIASQQDYAEGGEDFYANGNGAEERKQRAEERKKARQERRSKSGGSQVGNAFRGVATQENINSFVKVGMDFFGAWLQGKAQKSGNKDAIEYEKAQAQKYAAQAEANRAGSSSAPPPAGDTGGKNKWVKPVLISLGVIALGVTIFIIVKNRKSS